MATLKGVFPEPKPLRRKNFIHENVKNLRRMEQFFHSNKEVEELQKLQMLRLQKVPDKYMNITSRIDSSFRDAKMEDQNRMICQVATQKTETEEPSKPQHGPNLKFSAPMLVNKGNIVAMNRKAYRPKRWDRIVGSTGKRLQDTDSKTPSDPNLASEQLNVNEGSTNTLTKYRNQGIQTLDTKNLSSLYAEGTIRYPTNRSPRQGMVLFKSELGQQTDKTPREEARSPPSDRGDISLTSSPRESPHFHSSSPPGEGVDYVKLNKQRTTIASKMATQLNHGVPPSHYRKGVVPKYLRDRKEAQQQKEQLAKTEVPHPDCPEGHVPLPDSERKETLRMLKKNYQDFVNELNMMPIKTDTLRSQRRKMEIEKQLNKIEEGIKVFSRPKVYVKVNA